MSSIVLIDASDSSLTVSWPKVAGATRYHLQYRLSSNQEFLTLSDKLSATQARKKNLIDSDFQGFYFRVAAMDGDNSTDDKNWVTHQEAFHLLSPAEENERLPPPKVYLGGSNGSLKISWTASSSSPNPTYELQMRENQSGADWSTIASTLKSTEARKKNLDSPLGYQYRVRRAGTSLPFSAPSEPVVPLGFSDGLKRFFSSLEDGTLLQNANEPPVPVAEALGGKEFVLLYASAHWCGPCRSFTPKLTQWYQALGSGSTVECVFLSADHDKAGFKQYYSSMPWLAVDFDDDAREQLMGHIRVSGIPRLCVLDGRTGRIIEDNAIGKQLDINRWRALCGK